MDDIGKVLIRADTQVDKTRLHAALEIRNDVKVRRLVRDKVMGIELTFRFGKVLDMLGKLRSRDLDFCSRDDGSVSACLEPKPDEQDDEQGSAVREFARHQVNIR